MIIIIIIVRIVIITIITTYVHIRCIFVLRCMYEQHSSMHANIACSQKWCLASTKRVLFWKIVFRLNDIQLFKHSFGGKVLILSPLLCL